MKYQLRDEFMVAPTMGLDGERGVVRVIGALDFEAVPEGISETYLCGDDEYDQELRDATWYAFRYIDDADHPHWGVMYLPEELLESMEQAAAK